MTHKTEFCGFQPTGKSEDAPKPPKYSPENTDKLEEHLLPYKKEMVQKIRDEKMQLVTADEFLKLHKESLTAIRENNKLQEQLNTTKKALEYIINSNDTAFGFVNSNLRRYVEDALAAIGGDDE